MHAERAGKRNWKLEISFWRCGYTTTYISSMVKLYIYDLYVKEQNLYHPWKIIGKIKQDRLGRWNVGGTKIKLAGQTGWWMDVSSSLTWETTPIARPWRRHYRSITSPLVAEDQIKKIIVRHVAIATRTWSSSRCSPATGRGGAVGSGWWEGVMTSAGLWPVFTELRAETRLCASQIWWV